MSDTPSGAARTVPIARVAGTIAGRREAEIRDGRCTHEQHRTSGQEGPAITHPANPSPRAAIERPLPSVQPVPEDIRDARIKGAGCTRS